MRKNFKFMYNWKIILPILIIFSLSCSSKKIVNYEKEVIVESNYEVKKPKNIILLIGDGMGITQITSGLYSNNNQLNLERFKHIGLHKNYSYDALITDSAAGATAFACGVKTYNGAIGVDHDTVSVKTILEEAEENGLSTGVVATSTITHATPASFLAHDPYRKNYEAIAADFVDVDPEILIGGGQAYFERRESDNRNISEELKNKGYKVSSFVSEDLGEIHLNPNDKLLYFTADKDPLPAMQGRDYLQEAAEFSMSHLRKQNDKGFFLMIEGSQIDWGGHSNNAEYIISEMIEFDKVVGRALDFAQKDGNTLVIVTADHETGGFAIQKESKLNELVTAFTSDYHTADMIPVFAFGPGSETFNGIYENTEIYYKMKEAFGW